ncbi:hypothetical protein TNCT_354531 [Trichonephila clavata]|uniref:Uncharacterized protein n=1 Tax=Trichonephila clavata TaxID=2740835 RepID=A0A8X6F294_TRICU|nr:hypothetical protein TNCT_354531 [Trichonephila clavata]
MSTSSNIPDSGAQPGATWPPSPGFRRWYRGYPSSPVCISCNICLRNLLLHLPSTMHGALRLLLQKGS